MADLTRQDSSPFAQTPTQGSHLKRGIPQPWPQEEWDKFMKGYMYDDTAFMISGIESANEETGEVKAWVDTAEIPLVMSSFQRVREPFHPAHVSAPDLVMMTANVGCAHAYFFQGARWEDGWVGFGSRMKKVSFKNLSKIGPRLDILATQKRARKRDELLVIDYGFLFTQQGQVIYESEQTAMFVKQMEINH